MTKIDKSHIKILKSQENSALYIYRNDRIWSKSQQNIGSGLKLLAERWDLNTE